ncbi:RNA polymerase sigma factor [Streptococcus oralis]|nr:sigma factor-like helix-turn-helix DNA-binding protein [Streptococcus oralis]
MKVTDRRNKKIDEAVSNNEWDEVLRLMSQSLQNAERRDRYHSKQSLDKNISKGSRKTELHEIITNVVSSETQLLEKELIMHCDLALQQLSSVDRTIVLGRTAEKPLSFVELGRQVGLTDKTVKSHYLKALEQLKEYLSDYYYS